MANHLSWLQASVLAAQGGRPVRRDAWTRWLYKGPALWWSWYLDPTSGAETLHVVLNTELTTVDMMAADWTDEAWSTTPIYPPGVCCTPVAQALVPAPPADPASPEFCSCATGTPITGAPGVTTTTPGGSTETFTFTGRGNFGDAFNPPDPHSQIGVFIGGGMPGGGSGKPTETPVHQTPPVSTPTVTVEIIPPDDADFFAVDGRFLEATHDFDPTGDTSTPMVLPTLQFRVSVAGGPAGIYFISYAVGGGTAPANDNGFKGFAQDREGTGISFLPGGTITITATYTVGGTPYVGTGTYTFPGWHGWTLPTAFLFPTLAPVNWNAGIVGGTYEILLTRLTNGATTSTDVHPLTLTIGSGSITAHPSPGASANPLSAYPAESVEVVATAAPPFVATLSYAYPGGTLTAQMHVAADLSFTGSGQFLPD